MTETPAKTRARSPEQTLRRLFLTLFLRGRSSRGLKREAAPKSVGRKLWLMLGMYAAVGCVSFTFIGQPLFALSLYLHSMTLVFLGMFVAASAGEVLFNKDEADILMHRPVSARSLLWAKIAVLVQVSLWLGGAFNLAGFVVGALSTNGSWAYPVVHAVSTGLQALFCTGCVIMIYQLCLRWFGRERLEGLMTTAQVLLVVGAMAAGQIGPRWLIPMGKKMNVTHVGWIAALPPAWFAGFDDAIAGSHAATSWAMAAVGVAATAAVLWLAFGKLAQDYGAGLQTLNEARSAPSGRSGRRWMDTLTQSPPFSWWMRDSVERASFLLTSAYLVRDRDVKLRFYPGLAPFLVMPMVFLFQAHSMHGMANGFNLAFAGSFLGVVPMIALNVMRYSQQWLASDLFRATPIAGPGPLCNGARKAVLCFTTLPMLIAVAVAAWFIVRDHSTLALFIPGLIALPIYAMVPCIGGRAVPLSLPSEEAKSAGRGLSMMLVMAISFALAGASAFAWSSGHFKLFIFGEAIAAIITYAIIRRMLIDTKWAAVD